MLPKRNSGSQPAAPPQGAGPGKPPVDPYRKKQFTFSGGYLLFALALFWALQLLGGRGPAPKEIPYSEFLARLRAGQVERAEVSATEVEALIKARQGAPSTPPRAASRRAP